MVNGKSLIRHPVEAALKSKYVDEIWVATDCREISNTVLDIAPSSSKIKVFRRSDESASDTSNSEDVLLEFAHKYKTHGYSKEDFDVMIFMQCTSPLTLAQDIDGALELLESSDQINSVISGCHEEGGYFCGGFQWVEEDINTNVASAQSAGVKVARRVTPYEHQRQNAPKYFRENGAMYLTSKKDLIQSKKRLSGNIRFYEMPKCRSFEIDTPKDLIEIESILD
jgi:CMP-N-acetylneuraminic acid synthetase